MFRRSWLFAAPKKKAVNARAQSKTAGRTVAAASAPPSPLSPPPPRHSTLAPPPVASPTGAVSLVAAPRPVAPPPMKPAIPSRPPSLVSSQTPSSVATKITASTGALLPADVIQKKAEIERRRMEKDPVDREFELGCTERAYPAVPRALALSGIHFSDRHLRQILRIGGGGDASGNENSVTGEDDGSIGALPRRVPVRLNELTVNECELLFKHLALLAEGVRDARRFPSTADLPALECVNKDASPTQVFHCLTRNAELAAGAVTDSAATVPFTEVSDKYLRLPDVSTDDLRLCTPRTTDVTPDTEGVVFTMALENCNVSVGLEILRSRWNLARKNFNCAINGPSRSCNVVLVFAVGVPPGCLLNVNVMRFHGHVVRVSNLRRCTLATYKAMTATSQLETVVALRRVACPAPLLEARLRAVAASGCLRYAITGTSAKGATVMYHLVRGEPNQALAAWLDDDDAHPAIKLFLMSPSRTTAHKIVNDPKNKRLHATPQFRALRVLGASGSSTAALCALPVDVRSGLARETYATAFNSMLSKRQRTHGTKVVVGDTVRVTAESRSEFVTAENVKRVETDEEASQYTIDDVVLPWLAGTAVKAEHFPTCPGLTLAECIELLTPLNLAWMLPGCRPPTCRSFFDDEFTFCHKDDRETVWYRLVWSRPQVEVKVVAHPPPFSGDHHDATLLLPHDRGCLARRSSPVLPDGDTAPFALVKQLPREVSGAQTTWPTTRESKTAATSIAPVAAPHQRLVMPVMGYRRYALGPQSRVTTGKSFVSGYTIRDATGSLVTMDVKGEPVYRESTLPEDDFESVCHVVTAVLRFTHQFASDPNGLLRELFIQHGVTSDIDAGLQHAVHAHVAAKDTELDLSLADQYCADCFSVKHTSAACPLRLAFDAAHAAMIEARALEARQKSVRLSTPVLMTRASTAVKWGLSVEENGEIGSVVRGSPAFLCLESQLPEALLDQPFELLAGGQKKTPTAALPSPSSAAVLPREIVENTSTAKVDAIVPVQARIKVVAVNGVFCDGAEAVAEAVGRAADPLKVELSIRVMRRVLRDNQRPTRERPNTGTMMKPNKKRQQVGGGGG